MIWLLVVKERPMEEDVSFVLESDDAVASMRQPRRRDTKQVNYMIVFSEYFFPNKLTTPQGLLGSTR